MTGDSYRCSCGRGFKTAQGLAGHRRFCTKASHEPGAETGIRELLQRLSVLEGNYGLLRGVHQTSVRRINKLEKMIDGLVQFVCPTGKNIVGVNSSRIIQISAQLSNLKSEMDTSQEKLEREIKGWVWNVIPERFRPKL